MNIPKLLGIFYVTGGVITLVAEANTNRVAPLLPTSEPARRNCKLYHLRFKTLFRLESFKFVRYKVLFMAFRNM